RKKLNFGHTLGHAIESQAFESGNALMHGEAIALGMLAELFLSKKLNNLSDEDYLRSTSIIYKHFSDIVLDQQDLDAVLEFVKYDKKNNGEATQFVLISAIGTAEVDVEIGVPDMREALAYLGTLSE
ncbi:MAG: 3-dehydroquinate synthase, partial [Flavobacteriales bacterium]